MTTSEWHVDMEVWQRYAAGSLDYLAETAIDAHVSDCVQCRDLARQVEPVDVDALWSSVSAEISRPAVSNGDAVLLRSSDGLLTPWAVAVGSALVLAMFTGLLPRYQDFSFLLLAPLIPVLAVVAAFDATDPLRELVSGTPYSKLRLALLRTTGSMAVALPVTLLVGLVIPGLQNLAFLWLLPGLALTLTALVMITWLPPWPAGVAVSVVWTTSVAAVERLDQLAVLTAGTAQLAFAGGALVMCAFLVLRTRTVNLLGGNR